MSELTYIGGELDVFSHAVNWKAYFHTNLAPYIRGRVLEVGAGHSIMVSREADGSFTAKEVIADTHREFARLRQFAQISESGREVRARP